MPPSTNALPPQKKVCEGREKDNEDTTAGDLEELVRRVKFHFHFVWSYGVLGVRMSGGEYT